MREARRRDSGAPGRALVRGHTLGPGGEKEGRAPHRRGVNPTTCISFSELTDDYLVPVNVVGETGGHAVFESPL